MLDVNYNKCVLVSDLEDYEACPDEGDSIQAVHSDLGVNSYRIMGGNLKDEVIMYLKDLENAWGWHEEMGTTGDGGYTLNDEQFSFTHSECVEPVMYMGMEDDKPVYSSYWDELN